MKEASVKKERKHRIILYIIIGILSAGLGISLYGNLSSDYLSQSELKQHLGKMTFELPGTDMSDYAKWKYWPTYSDEPDMVPGVLSEMGEDGQIISKGYSEWTDEDCPIYVDVGYRFNESMSKSKRIDPKRLGADVSRDIKNLKVGMNEDINTSFDDYWIRMIFELKGKEYIIDISQDSMANDIDLEWMAGQILTSIEYDKSLKDEFEEENGDITERESTGEIYTGKGISKLLSYDIPKGYTKWSESAPHFQVRPITTIDYVKEPDDVRSVMLSVDLLKYNGAFKGLMNMEGEEDITLKKYLEDDEIIKTFTVDGETGYITAITTELDEEDPDNDKEILTGLSLWVEHNDSWFCVMLTDENDKKLSREYKDDFYETIKTITFKE